MIDELNSRHAIPEHLRFGAGPNNMPLALIENDHASAEVHLHGGHVTAFQPRNRKPILWMSREAAFCPPKPIRGGIPICWPWFGNSAEHPDRPQHGFARNREWRVVRADTGAAGETILDLGLESDPGTMELWPHAFELSLKVIVASSLTVQLTFRNTGADPATAATALHTYFAVGGIDHVRITGLDGREYHDQLDSMIVKRQTGDITIAEEVDRIYLDTEDDCVIHDAAWKRSIRVAKTGSRSTVVWNPWIEKSKRMLDFPNDGYPEMVCIETTNAAKDQRTVEPGSSHTLSQTVSVDRA